MSGILITFEGVEGCGKTTQIALLRDHLERRGFKVEVSREPGGSPIAEAIRGILLDPAHKGMDDVAELLLYESARAQHIKDCIRPALEAGKVVLCDRFVDSTTAYQGGGRGLDRGLLDLANQLATAGIWPNLTFVIDLPVNTGLERARTRGRADRLEQESVAFHERVRQAFLDLARREPKRVALIDGSQDIDGVFGSIRDHVEEWLRKKSQT